MYYVKRKQAKISFAWLMGIVCCGALFAVGCHKVYITNDEVHQRIKSGIPPGSTYDQVNEFLRKQNWGSDPIREFESFGTLDEMLTEEEKRTIKWVSYGGIPEVEKTLLGGRGITMSFYYDKEVKLVTYKIFNYGI